MASLNFPPTTPGVSGPEYTLNGIVYYWDGEKWTANSEDGFTDVFVNVDGDNMTGDLTLGDGTDDKITLDATGGSAEFLGKLNVAAGTSSFISGSTNSIATSANNTDALMIIAEANDGLGLRIQNTNPSPSITGSTKAFRVRSNAGGAENDYVSIGWDGTATFAGGNYTINASGGVNQFARINVKVGPDPTTSAFSVANITGSGIKSRWYGDGSLSIGGTIGGNGVATDNANITLNAGDGSAKFAGSVSSETPINSTNAEEGYSLYPVGALYLSRPSTQTAIYIKDATTGGIKTTLNTDGSAEFSGEVKKDSFDNTSNSGFGWRFSNGADFGQLDIQMTSTGVGANKVFRVFNGTTEKVSIDGDGSATFARSISNGVGSGGCDLLINGFNSPEQRGTLRLRALSTLTNTATSSAIIVSDGNSNTYTLNYNGTATLRNLAFNLEPDNDANYVSTTDVDEEGNTVESRVYNGPTLDVKAVIQELQQRVNDRDAVIADLTTRIQTLEGGNY